MLNFYDLPKDGTTYFAGIGGISMSALALILVNRGYKVSGHDKSRSQITEKLEENGIKIYYNTDIKNLEGVSCAVYSAALGQDHPEIVNIKNKGIPLYKRAQLLGAIANLYKNAVGIAGTHGKSTTSSMLAHVFMSQPTSDPTVLVGAVMKNIDSTFRLGRDDNFVFEACEYQDAFLSFFPKIGVILNVELDHTDYFPTMDRLVLSFKGFLKNIREGGYAVVNIDSPGARDCVEGYDRSVVTYSSAGNIKADYHAQNITLRKGYATFDVYKAEKYMTRISLSVPGLHNVSNAMATIACCDICNVDSKTISQGLMTFDGVKRRFEYKGLFKDAHVFDDYAHHPEEIKATLATAKSMGYKRVVSVFQPHTHARLHDLFDDFTKAFGDSDVTLIADVYAARESDLYKETSLDLAKRIEGSLYLDSFIKIEEYLKTILTPGDLLIFMGAGSITDLAQSVVVNNM